MVAPAENDQAAYRYALDVATKAGDQAALGQLNTLGAPPYAGKDLFANYTALRRAALRATGAAYPANPFRTTSAQAIATAPEYSDDERQRLPQAEAETFAVLYPQLARIDLTKQVPALGIPVYVIAGRFDVTSSAPSVERWVETLQAPAKSLTWFELSGRAPTYEEPDKFLQVMVTRVLTETFGRREVTH
jgi:pimeloyl-ACP methyl ester carboxylesterase